MSAATPDQATPAAVPPKRAAGAREMPPWVEKILVPIVFLYLILIMVFKPSGLLGEQTRDAG
jgi:hypothetical protein